MKIYLYLTLLVGIVSAGFHALPIWRILPQSIAYSDVLGFSKWALTPGTPYLEKNIEYPPLVGWFIELMGRSGGNIAGYYIASSIFLILLAVLATRILYKMTSDRWRFNLLRFWIFAPSMFFFLTYNWDIIPVLLVIPAFYFWQKEKDLLVAVFLGLGFSSKLFPILYLPVLILKNFSWRRTGKIISGFFGAAALINGYFALANFSGWSYFWQINNARNSNPDSIWTIIRFFFRWLKVPDINLISGVLILGFYVWFLWKYRGESFLKLNLGATLIFLIFNKVFTPQYLMWLLPFWVLLPGVIKLSQFYILELANLGALFTILPWFFAEKNITYFYLSSPFVVLRHALLILILVRLIKRQEFG